MRLTVIGCGPAEPQSDTGGSGFLVQAGVDSVLLDCGPGVIGRLRRLMDPLTLSAVVVSHLHADHYLDVVALRYLLSWAGAERRLPVYLPPGGNERIHSLAHAISERRWFFHDALDIREYEPERRLEVGSLAVHFVPARHYIPAWSARLTDSGGAVLAYTGDTGPSANLVSLARRAQLLISEATLDGSIEDDLDRGHLTVEEATRLAAEAEVHHLLLTHFKTSRRDSLAVGARLSPVPATVAQPGLAIEILANDVRLFPPNAASGSPAVSAADSRSLTRAATS